MDEKDIFQKLRSSIKFDGRHLKSDRCKLSALKSKSKSQSQLNFFKTKRHKVVNIETPKLANSVVDQTYNCSQQEKRKILAAEDCKTLRIKNKIFVDGEDIPEPVKTFTELEALYDSNHSLIENIVIKKGFSKMTPIQMQAIPAMLHGREILACAPTGSGKTVAFLVPILSQILKTRTKYKMGLQALIVSPTRELAEQTFRECKELIKIQNPSDVSTKMEDLVCVKIMDKPETKSFTHNGLKQAKCIDLLISTPNRLVYLLQQNPPLISLETVKWLVVDECDKLFEEGPGSRSFREQLGIIYSSCTNPLVRRAMFSATFAFDVQQWCLLNMDNVLQITIGGKNTAVLSVDQSLQYVGNEQGKLLALQQLIREGFSPPVIIFVQSKDRAKELFAEMIYDGVNIDAIHADRTPAQRENAIKSMRRGETWILICTELLGRGIDFKGVNLVVNYDFPTSAVSYIHRIGRTGRAGMHGKAITFFTDADRPLLRSIANVIREAGCHVPGYMLQLKKPQKDEMKRMSQKAQKRLTIRSAPPEILNPKKQKFAVAKKNKGNRRNKSTNLKHNLTQENKEKV